jgi:hypothetical protein
MYVIQLNHGDYYEQRGGYDWGRASRHQATVFDTREQAEAEIVRCKLASFGARVVDAD